MPRGTQTQETQTPGPEGGSPKKMTPGEPERGSKFPRGDVGESPDCPPRTPGMRRSSVWGLSAEHNNLWMRVPDEGERREEWRVRGRKMAACRAR